MMPFLHDRGPVSEQFSTKPSSRVRSVKTIDTTRSEENTAGIQLRWKNILDKSLGPFDSVSVASTIASSDVNQLFTRP